MNTSNRNSSQSVQPDRNESTVEPKDAPNGTESKADNATAKKGLLLLLLDWPLILSLVYGGCCVNAYSLEVLLKHSSNIGTTLTFCQMCFISLYGLPSFLVFYKSFPFIGLKPSVVSAKGWAMQVFVLWIMSLLNNWAFAFDIPLTVQIVFRSGGPAVSVLYGYWLLRRRYNSIQLVSILFVTYGIILTSLSRPGASAKGSTSNTQGYSAGIALLTVALFLTGYLGYLQEKTYRQYKPWWKEGLFYTHLLSLPLFIPFLPAIIDGLKVLSTHSGDGPSHLLTTIPVNLLSQLACVAGVNMLTSRLSSVSTNLILTSRKALSLCISVWWFGNAWTRGMSIGSALVGLGTVAYTWGGARQRIKVD